MKKLLLFPCLLLALGLSSCESSDDEIMSIELVSPKKLAVTTELATASFKWDAVAKAEGYAYALDNSTEYTTIDAATTTLKLTRLSRGSHTFRIYAVGNQEHTTDSAERTVDFDIDPTLPTPAPSCTRGESADEVVVTWQAVKGAIGYAYKFNDETQWTEVGADVLKITKSGFDPEAKNTFTIYAKGQLPDSEDSEELTLSFQLIDTSEGVWARTSDGSLYELKESESGIYTAAITCKASDDITILIENTPYGFTAYSGNGGIGTVNSVYATVPFYTYPAAVYYVRESLGQMTAKTEDADINKFWVNVSGSTCKIDVEIDCTNADKTPRYRLKLVENEDPSIILEQYFDLMVYGGDWIQTGKVASSGRKLASTSPAAIDGTEPATATASYTTFGINISSDKDAAPAYLANRGLTDWGIKYCYEFPGYVRLSNSASGSNMYYGVLTTPKLSKLTAASIVTVTFDAVRFASEHDIPVKVLNAGTIASAQVVVEGSGSAASIAPESGGKSINITSAHCPKHGNEALKKWSNFSITIEGATAETQICWDTTGAGSTSATGRICLDNIVVRKN